MASEVRSDPKATDGPWLREALEEAGVVRGAKVPDVESVGYIESVTLRFTALKPAARYALSCDRARTDVTADDSGAGPAPVTLGGLTRFRLVPTGDAGVSP